MGEKVMLQEPFLSHVNSCTACDPLRGGPDGGKVCPAANDVFYGGVGHPERDHCRCDLISALVGGNVDKVLKLGKRVRAHHGTELRCDPLTGVKRIREWLRKIGVKLEDKNDKRGCGVGIDQSADEDFGFPG